MNNRTYITKIIKYKGELCLVIPKELQKYGWKEGANVSFETIDKDTIRLRLIDSGS